MLVVDLFSGAGGWSSSFVERGHTVITIDHEEWFKPTIRADIRDITAADLPPQVDVVLASPPCEGFSIAAVRWNYRDGKPYGWRAKDGIDLVAHTLRLVNELHPRWWIIENPRGMLHRLGLIPRAPVTVTMCQYGGERQKPTHLWGEFPPSLRLKAPCKQGDPCHAPQPRGNYNGHALQRLPVWQKAMIPKKLSRAVCRAAERDLG